MKTRCMKSIKIANEIMSILTHSKAGHLTSDIRFKREVTLFSFSVTPSPFSEKELADFLEILNLPRQSEMEEYYWSLLGESKSDDNLNVLARMVDDATANVEDRTLHLHITRKDA
jgi:hypothetical protein